MKTQNATIEKSSGNIFADLGLEHPEEMRARGLLGAQIVKLLKAKNKTQQQLAASLDIPQSDISQLFNARFDRYSTDKLLDLLQKLDQKVTFRISPRVKGDAYHAVAYGDAPEDFESLTA